MIGELVTGIMLAKHGGRKAAAGWDGDSALIFEGPDEKLGLVWLSTWDTEADAREFARGYAAFQTVKFAPPPPAPAEAEGGGQGGGEGDAEGDAGAPAESVEADSKDDPVDGAGAFAAEGRDDVLRRPMPADDAAALHVELRGSDVLVIEGFGPDVTDALAKSALAAKKTEKTNAPKAAGDDAGGKDGA